MIPRAPKGYSIDAGGEAVYDPALDVREPAGDVDERGCPPDPAPASSVGSCADADRGCLACGNGLVGGRCPAGCFETQPRTTTPSERLAEQDDEMRRRTTHYRGEP